MGEKDKVQEKETAFKKGIELEKEFCEYLKTNLGWEKARIRSQMASKYNMRGTNVDIIAERTDKRGKRLKKIGIVYVLFFVFLMLFGILQDDEELKEMLLILGIIFEFGGILMFVLSLKFNKENAWVECKNLKTKATYEQVSKTINEYNAYKESGSKEYKFVECYFVSVNGFVETALKLATDNKIVCYIKENEKFKKIDYWNH